MTTLRSPQLAHTIQRLIALRLRASIHCRSKVVLAAAPSLPVRVTQHWITKGTVMTQLPQLEEHHPAPQCAAPQSRHSLQVQGGWGAAAEVPAVLPMQKESEPC